MVTMEDRWREFATKNKNTANGVWGGGTFTLLAWGTQTICLGSPYQQATLAKKRFSFFYFLHHQALTLVELSIENGVKVRG